MAKIGVGSRVQRRGKNEALGAVTAPGVDKNSWVVIWDTGAASETLNARALVVVTAGLALSPSSKGIADAARVARGAADERVGAEAEPQMEDDVASVSSSSSSEDEALNDRLGQNDQNPHVVRRALFQGKFDALVGKTVKVTNAGKSTTWTYVADGSQTRDDFVTTVEGTLGSKGTSSRQVPVLNGLELMAGELEKLKVWLFLYPGEIEGDLRQINEALVSQNPGGKPWPATLHEYVKFIGLVHASRLYTQKGQALWASESTGLRVAPNFKQYGMSWNRFQQLMRAVPWAFAKKTASMTDPWWRFRRGIEGFNVNRARSIIMSCVFVLDESMSSWAPQTSATGGLPNISFIKRKPKPLGTEFKNACDGLHGVMLLLEVQEGKDPQRAKKFVQALGGNAACALRVALGVVCSYL